jgi:peroxiredoxin
MRKLVFVAVMAAAVAFVCSAKAADKPGAGDQFVDFQLKDLDGKDVKTADLRKDKILVLKFGATWCPPCTAQIPQLNKVVASYPADKVVVLEVDLQEPAEKVKEHGKKHEVKYMVVLDPDGGIARQYHVGGIPTVLVVDKAGKIASRSFYTPFDALKKTIDSLMPPPPEKSKA